MSFCMCTYASLIAGGDGCSAAPGDLVRYFLHAYYFGVHLPPVSADALDYGTNRSARMSRIRVCDSLGAHGDECSSNLRGRTNLIDGDTQRSKCDQARHSAASHIPLGQRVARRGAQLDGGRGYVKVRLTEWCPYSALRLSRCRPHSAAQSDLLPIR